jgi:hypothetical protein
MEEVSKMNILSFDAGYGGAVNIWRNSEHVGVLDFSKHEVTNFINGTKLFNEIVEIEYNFDVIVIEKQFNKDASNRGRGSIKKQIGGFTNGTNYGVLIGVIQRLLSDNTKFIERPAITWQKFFNIYGASKERIAQKAVERGFPESHLYTPRGRLLDGRTDSYLIGLHTLIIEEQMRKRGIR